MILPCDSLNSFGFDGNCYDEGYPTVIASDLICKKLNVNRRYKRDMKERIDYADDPQIDMQQSVPMQPEQMQQAPMYQEQMQQVPMQQMSAQQVPMYQPQMQQVPMYQPQMQQMPMYQPQMQQGAVGAVYRNDAAAMLSNAQGMFQENQNPQPQQNQGFKNYMVMPTGGGDDNYGHSDSIPEGNTAYEEQIDKYEIEDEHIRFLNETKKQEKLKNKSSSGNRFNDERDLFLDKGNINRAEDRGAALINARMHYDADMGASDLSIELLKFTDHSTVRKREYREYKRRSIKIKKSIKKAKAQERKATRRYYEVLAREARSLTILKKANDQETLCLILTRLEKLIRQREDIDARLIQLYNGADTEAGGRIKEKAEKKKYKRAKRVQRSLRASNRRLEKMDVPQGLKTKIRFLFNTKIVSEATVTYSKYLLTKLKPMGDARHELKSNIKSANESLARLDDSLRRMMNKAERYEKSRKRTRRWVGFLVFLVLAAITVGIIIIGMGA